MGATQVLVEGVTSAGVPTGLLVAADGTVQVGGTITATTTGLTDTQLRASAVPVSLATLPALAAGSAVIGHVIVDSGAVTATLAAETTKVIGTVNVAAAQSIAVTQATAASLNATIVGTGTFVTQATLAAETTKVIGTVNIASGQTVGLAAGAQVIGSISNTGFTANAGTNLNTSLLALDSTLTGGTQQAQALGQYKATKPTLSDGQTTPLQVGTRGSLDVTLYNVDGLVGAAVGVTNTDTQGNSNGLIVHGRAAVWNGSSWDLARGANSAAATTGTGLLGAGQLVFDGTNWQKQKADTSGVTTTIATIAVGTGAGLALNTYEGRLTTNATTTLTSATAYISSIVITSEVAGTTSTITIRDKQGTPQVLVNGLTTTAASLSPTTLDFQTPIKMTSGIDVITAGAVAATVDVWVNYYQ